MVIPDKEKVSSALLPVFNSLDKEKTGTVNVDQVGHILRYIGQFPPEGELFEVIIKQLVDEAQSREIPLPLIEKLALRLISDREYEPDFADTLLEAFRAMDPLNAGYISVEQASDLLTAGATGFREKELNDFVKYVRDKKNPSRIYYDEYVSRLTRLNNRHLTKLWNPYN